jgi:hypothetical protein
MNRKSFIAGYVAVVLVIACLQLALGANFLLLAAMALVSAAGLIPLSQRSLIVIDLLFFGFVLYYGPAALLIKCALLQPIDQNLITPYMSAAYLMLGFSSATGGYLIARALFRQSRWIARHAALMDNREYCRRLAVPAFIVGFAMVLLHNIFRAQVVQGSIEEGGFGGFGAFYFLLPLGWAAQARLTFGNGKTKRDTIALAIIGMLSLLLALIANVKVILLQFFVVIALSFVAFDLRIRLRAITLSVLAALVLVLYVQPVIQITRAEGEGRSTTERFKMILPVLEDANFNPAILAEEQNKIGRGYKLRYMGSYVYPATWNVDRFAMIMPIDQVARSLDVVGSMGGSDLVNEILQSTLPGFVIKKTGVVTADAIGWHFGVTRNGSISRPVFGLLASSLAAYGVVGLILLPAFTIFLTFACINLIATRFERSPWAIFIFMMFLPLVEKEVAPVVATLIRQIPLYGTGIAIIYATITHFALPRRPGRDLRARYL